MPGLRRKTYWRRGWAPTRIVNGGCPAGADLKGYKGIAFSLGWNVKKKDSLLGVSEGRQGRRER
eukprot:5084299-Prorocentrum_lima.AAC.1